VADLTPISLTQTALDALPSQFVGKARMQALVLRLAARWQLLETVLWQLQTQRGVETAEGVQLDQIGELVGQVREGGAYPLGESDDLYRIKIRARALRNRSSGTVPDLQAIMHALLPAKAVAVQCVDVPPAAFVMAIQASAALTAAEEAIVAEFANGAKAAGVKIAGICWYTDPTFAFAGFPDPPFAGYDDGSGAVGGFWAHYFYP
jgi:hypothetical protein